MTPPTSLDERPSGTAIDPRTVPGASPSAATRAGGGSAASCAWRCSSPSSRPARSPPTPLLDVDEVDVGGNVRTDRAAVTASGIAVGDPMTDVDLAVARRGIDQLPWIDANVDRELARDRPDPRHERVPVSAVAQSGRVVLVDARDTVLGRGPARPPEWPRPQTSRCPAGGRCCRPRAVRAARGVL